jgi:hypothetical protein
VTAGSRDSRFLHRSAIQGHAFDEYPHADGTTAHFYERYQKGELDQKSAGWVNPSDFEDPVP